MIFNWLYFNAWFWYVWYISCFGPWLILPIIYLFWKPINYPSWRIFHVYFILGTSFFYHFLLCTFNLILIMSIPEIGLNMSNSNNNKPLAKITHPSLKIRVTRQVKDHLLTTTKPKILEQNLQVIINIPNMQRNVCPTCILVIYQVNCFSFFTYFSNSYVVENILLYVYRPSTTMESLKLSRIQLAFTGMNQWNQGLYWKTT